VRPDPDISINVDIRNPGQFFACCGLLEISSRIWPDSEGWFEITGRRTTYCIATSSEHDDPLGEIVRRIREPDTVILTDDADDYPPGLRPLLLIPFDLRLDWWIKDGSVNKKSPLKMWAGQQTPLRIMTDMQTESCGKSLRDGACSPNSARCEGDGVLMRRRLGLLVVWAIRRMSRTCAGRPFQPRSYSLQSGSNAADLCK